MISLVEIGVVPRGLRGLVTSILRLSLGDTGVAGAAGSDSDIERGFRHSDKLRNDADGEYDVCCHKGGRKTISGWV